MELYTTQQRILLNEQPLGSGAEGNVHEVVAPRHYQNCVAKVYHSHEQQKNREPKIKRLITFGVNQAVTPQVIFPQECIYNTRGDFVGFLMPKVIAPYHLTSLCSLGLAPTMPKEWQNKYHRDAYNLYFRLTICKNLAEQVASLHRTQCYVFADLKPENIKINLEGEVFLLDIDSIQLLDEHQMLLYPAKKVTPEYAPQEIKWLNFQEDAIPETWDRFSLGVIFYKILLGLHPYTGTCLPPYEELVSNEQKIQANLLPLGERAGYFDIIPAPHQEFGQLPEKIQASLMASFQMAPSLRPTAYDWFAIFEKQLKSMSKPMVREQTLAATAEEKTLTSPASWTLLTDAKAQRDVGRLVAVNAAAFLVMLSLIKFISWSGIFTIQGISEEVCFLTEEGVDKHEKGIVLSEVKPVYVSKGKINIETGKFGLVHHSGKLLLPYDYDWIGNFKEGLAHIVWHSKTGYVNERGKIIIPLIYDEAWPFQHGFARVIVAKKTGMINKNGELLVPIYYDGMWNFDRLTHGLARVERHGKYGFINQQGKEVIDLYFDGADDFAGKKFTKVKIGKDAFAIDRQGHILGRYEAITYARGQCLGR